LSGFRRMLKHKFSGFLKNRDIEFCL
jgi:hypothetical protein